MQSQFTTAISYRKATKYAKGTEEKGKVLMGKEKTSEEKSKRSEDKDSTPDDFSESVGDVKVCYFLMIYVYILLCTLYCIGGE